MHSCGTVPPHGVDELAQPEAGFYIVGMKSYGRAPTFLMLTGYEQARSIACALTGDLAGARRVELTLPATGVCSAAPGDAGIVAGAAAGSSAACCGGPAPADVDACCAEDAEAKAVGKDGCGCAAEHAVEVPAAGAAVARAAARSGAASAARLLTLGAPGRRAGTNPCCGGE